MAVEPESEKDYPVLLGRSFRDDENLIHVLRCISYCLTIIPSRFLAAR